MKRRTLSSTASSQWLTSWPDVPGSSKSIQICPGIRSTCKERYLYACHYLRGVRKNRIFSLRISDFRRKQQTVHSFLTSSCTNQSRVGNSIVQRLLIRLDYVRVSRRQRVLCAVSSYYLQTNIFYPLANVFLSNEF